MDGDESGLTSYYHHHHPQQHQPHHSTTTTSNTNGVFSDPQHHHPHHHNHHHNHNHNHSTPTIHYSSSEPTPTPLSFPQHSVPTRAPPPPPPPPSQPLTSSTTTPPPPEAVKRKRGRPRKYGTPETSSQTGSASVSSSKNLPSSSSPSLPLPSSSPPRKKDPSFVSSSKKNQLFALGNAGQNFIPHIITVTAGEDVTQRIMSFTQQRKRAVCILSASGSISNASIRQPATLGGNVTYEGRFEILSLSGSFLHTETEGGSSRTGGLSVCLSATDGRIIGGGVGGPLKAAGPVQVIIGSFVIDTNKESNADPKVETSSGKLPQVIGATFSNVDYRTLDSSVRTSGRGNNDHQHMAVNNFMLQSRGLHSMPSHPTDWRDGPSFADHGACQSSEEGDDGNLHH